jgi:hypothetical protein
LRPVEQELLLACAQAGSGAERRGRVAAALGRRPEPRETMRLALAHGVVPLVADGVGEATGEPPDAAGAWSELHAEARQIVHRTLFLTGELLALLRQFERAGIPVLPFKGPVLAVAAYGSLGRRSFADLDLLVQPEAFRAASELLLGAGYAQHRDAWQAVRHLSHEVAFDGHGGRVQIDLHRRLFSRELPTIEARRLWERAERVRVNEVEVATLDALTTTLLLCEHAHKHGWSRLAWIADLAHWLARRGDLDWDRLVARARASGSLRVLDTGVELAGRLLGAPAPPAPYRERLARPAARALAAELERRLFAPSAIGLTGKRELAALQWRGRERWRDRLAFAVTPNEDDWLVWPLPEALFGVYYLIRPLRLALTYVWTRIRPYGVRPTH